MALKISKADVWAAEIMDRPGAAARILSTLAQAGANLEFVIGRRQADRPGTGVLFVTPLKGKKVQTAAKAAGSFSIDNRIMYTIGAAARKLKLLNSDVIIGFPLSVTGKSPYFDR